MTTSTTFINFINTGTSPNSGNGDSLRTAFNKINVNFQSLLDNFVTAGVSSFNNQTGIITFTGTDIISNLGFTPYPYSNPEGYITSSTANLQNLASISFVNSNFVSNSNLISYNYVTQNYVDAKLTEYPTLVYLNNQNFLVPATLPDFLTGYATLTDLGNTADDVRSFTTSSIYTAIKQSSLIPALAATYNLGAEDYTWGNLYLGGAVYLQGIGISVDPVTGKLFVNGNNVTGGFSFTPTAVWNDNNLNFTLSSSQPNATTNRPKAGISFPADSQTNDYSLDLFNTGTNGITLKGLTTTVGIDNDTIGVSVDTKFILPIRHQGTAAVWPVNTTGNHILELKGNSNINMGTFQSSFELESYQQIASYSTSSAAPLLIKGSRLNFIALSKRDDQAFVADDEYPGFISLDETGVYVGYNYTRGHGAVPDMQWAFEGYKLPLGRGTVGQVLGIASTGTYLDTVEWVNGGGGGEYTPTTPADWTGSPTVGTVVAGLDELAFRVSNVEGLNGSALSNLVNGPYTVSLSTSGSLTLPIGVSIDESNGSHFPRIVADTGKAFSLQGQGSTGSAAIAWLDYESTSSQYAAVGVSKGGGEGLANVLLTAGATTPTLKVWRFDETGTTTFPDGTTSTGNVVVANSSSYQIKTNYFIVGNPYTATFEFDEAKLVLPGNGVIKNQGSLWQLDTTSKAFIFPNNGKLSYGIIPFISTTINDIVVNAINTGSVYIRSGSNTWAFGNDGKVTAPGNLQVDGGKIILNTGGNAYVESVDYGVNTATSALNIFGGPYQKIKLRAGFGTEAIWTFGTTGSLTFPDTTVQTTAWTGTVAYSSITNVPSVSTSTLVNGTSTVTLGSTGTLTVPGSIIPATDIAYDLGSPTNRFRDIYVSSSTIFIGTSTISISQTGQMLVNGNDAVSKLEYFGGEGSSPRDASSIGWNTSTFTFNIPGKELLTAIYDLKPGNKIRGVNTQLPQFGGFDREFTIVGNAREYIRSGGYQMAAIDIEETTSTNRYVYALYLPVKDKSATLSNGTSTLTVSTTGTVVFPNGTIQTGAAISRVELKTLVAASTDFVDFKSRIAAL